MKLKYRKLVEYLLKCNQESTEKILYIAGFVALVCILISYAITQLIKHYLGIAFGICIFYNLTGYYCPGCGGTRAILSFLHGDIIKSLLYNAFSTYLFLVTIIFMGSHTLFYLTKGKIKGLKYRPWFLYVGLAILLLQWLIKNSLVFFFSIHII